MGVLLLMRREEEVEVKLMVVRAAVISSMAATRAVAMRELPFDSILTDSETTKRMLEYSLSPNPSVNRFAQVVVLRLVSALLPAALCSRSSSSRERPPLLADEALLNCAPAMKEDSTTTRSWYAAIWVVDITALYLRSCSASWPSACERKRISPEPIESGGAEKESREGSPTSPASQQQRPQPIQQALPCHAQWRLGSAPMGYQFPSTAVAHAFAQVRILSGYSAPGRYNLLRPKLLQQLR